MTDIIETPAASSAKRKRRPKPGRPRRKHQRRHIALPDGDVLIPRTELAEEIGCSERSLQSLKTPVTTISNVAYVARNAALAAYVAAHTRHPPEPPKPRRRR